MTDHLTLDQMSEAQSNKYITHNNSNAQLDAAIADTFAAVITSSNAFTITKLQLQRANMIICTEAGGDVPTAQITMTLAAAFSRGIFVLINDTNQIIQMEVSGQSEASPIVGAGNASAMIVDGANVRKLSG